MLVPDGFRWLIAPLPLLASGSVGLWAYIGLGPGKEFIPQFLAMLGLASTALLAVVQWPIVALWSRLSRAIGARKNGQTNPASAADAPERPDEEYPYKP